MSGTFHFWEIVQNLTTLAFSCINIIICDSLLEIQRWMLREIYWIELNWIVPEINFLTTINDTNNIWKFLHPTIQYQQYIFVLSSYNTTPKLYLKISSSIHNINTTICLKNVNIGDQRIYCNIYRPPLVDRSESSQAQTFRQWASFGFNQLEHVYWPIRNQLAAEYSTDS